MCSIPNIWPQKPQNCLFFMTGTPLTKIPIHLLLNDVRKIRHILRFNYKFCFLFLFSMFWTIFKYSWAENYISILNGIYCWLSNKALVTRPILRDEDFGSASDFFPTAGARSGLLILFSERTCTLNFYLKCISKK